MTTTTDDLTSSMTMSVAPQATISPFPSQGVPDELPLRFVLRSVLKSRRRLALLRELVLYVPFLLIFIFYEIYGLQMEHRYWMNQQVGGNLLSGQIGSKESIWTLRPGEIAGYHTFLSFQSIRDVDEWHAWAQSILITELWDAGVNTDANQTDDYSSRWIVGGNRQLGAVRFRVLRVFGDSCTLNTNVVTPQTFRSVAFLNPEAGVGVGGCYPSFSTPQVNTSDLALGASSVVRRGGVNTMPFVACSISGSYDWGLHGSYPCSGNVFDVPFSLSSTEAASEVQRMRNAFQSSALQGAIHESMIDTRLVAVEFFTYTAALDLFTKVQCLAEVSVGTQMITYVRTTNFVLWTPSHAGYTAYYAVFMLIVLLYLIAVVRSVWYSSYVAGDVKKLLTSGWFFVDLANLCMFIASFVVHGLWITRSVEAKPQVWYPTLSERDNYPEALEHVAFLSALESYFNITNTILCFIKLCKFTALHRSMGVVLQTLQKAKDSLLSVLSIFLLVILAYAVGATVLFGPFMPDMFGTVSFSFSSLLRLLIGDFDYDRMRMVNSTVAGMFFWSYVILGLFLLLSFFVGTLASVFTDERSKMDEDQRQSWKEDYRSVVESITVPSASQVMQAARSPWTAVKERFDAFLRWLERPRHLATIQVALNDFRCKLDTDPKLLQRALEGASPSETPVESPGATTTIQSRHARVSLSDVLQLFIQHKDNNQVTAEEEEVITQCWKDALLERTFDQDTRDEAEYDEKTELLKTAVTEVLTEIFGSTPATTQKQQQQERKLWKLLREVAASDSQDARSSQELPPWSVESAKTALDALQVRDVLLNEEQVRKQLRGLNAVVSRLEDSVLRAARRIQDEEARQKRVSH